MPKDLRPINIARNVAEETRIAPPLTTSGRSPDGLYPNPPRGDVSSPPSLPLHYTDAAGFPGVGVMNPGGANLSQPAAWAPWMPAPVGPPPPSNSSMTSSGYAYSPNFSSRVSGNGTSAAIDQVSEDGGDDSVSGKKVKFLCSFGGKILPRPSDGMLRYVGGQTRIISVRRDVTFGDLHQKMVDTCGPPVMIKYQLPDEDLDALVSVSCSEDLDNMMEEYEKLLERSSDGSAKLRVFLFSASELDLSGLVQLGGLQDTGQKYVDAVNGIAEGTGGGITRKESIASVASTQNSDVSGPEVFDGVVGPDVTGPSQAETEIERTVPVRASGEQQPLGYDLQQPGLNFQPRSVPFLDSYVDPNQDALSRGASQVVYANPQVLGAPRPILIRPQFRDSAPTMLTHQFIPAVQMTMAPTTSHLSMNPNIVQPSIQPPRVVAIPADQSYNNPYPAQIGGGYGWHQITPQDHVALSEGWMPHQQVIPVTADCYMCQKALPHAHSDTAVQDQKVSQSTMVPDTSPIYHSLHLDDVTRRYAMVPSNQGMMGLIGEIQSPYAAVRGNLPVSGPEDAIQQHLVASSHLKHEPLVSKPVNGENASVTAVTYHVPEPFIPETSKDYSAKIPGTAYREDVIRPAISHDRVRPVDFIADNLQIKPSDMPPSNEQGKPPADQLKKDDIFEQVLPQTLGREALPNVAFSRPAPPALVQEANQIKPSEIQACSVTEVSYQHNEVVQAPLLANLNPQPRLGVHLFDENPLHLVGDSSCMAERTSPSNDLRDDVSIFQGVGPSGSETVTSNSNVQPSISPNWGAIENDSTNSLFSYQDPWNMRHEAHFPPPKPSKIATKREASAVKEMDADNHLGHIGESNESNAEAHQRSSSEQVQTGKGSAEERIKEQLQLTAEGVAASVLQSSVPSNADLSSQETSVSVSEAGQVIEGQNNTDAVIQAKMEAMNIKQEKTNFGFPLSDGLGRLQIIKNIDLEELRELGSGTFGTVYHGKWRGTDVAIKRINDRCFTGKPSEQERMRDDFWNEAIKLADLHHPNVVAFYGVVLDGPGGSVATVTEYMVNGSLRNALQKNGRNLDKRKRCLIAMDVAFGMEYLHSKNIVHFDLKSDNLLVNLRDPHRPICKVGDLGLSKVKCQTLISGGVRGTLPWMAPELLNGSSSLVSEKVDVFSFGIVLWELLTGEEPYAELHYGAIIGGIVSNTLRPPVPENCDPDWRCLMERCWSAETSERPTFTEIANELRSMAAKIPQKAQTPASNTRTNA